MQNRGITLILILALILVVVVLSNVALVFIRNQAWHIHYQVERIKAYYAAQAGINYTIEKLRIGDWSPDSVPRYYCINGPVDTGVSCTVIDPIITDTDIPFNVQLRIYAEGGGENGTTEIEAKVGY